MAVASSRAHIAEPFQSREASPSRRLSDAASDSYTGGVSSIVDASNRPITSDQPISASTSFREFEIQPHASMRSEEYRQLFRLPSEEVLVQDFNCALQESFLLQGHMYLFMRYICFYSNLFGFETKKIIPFYEITSVRRAKAAAIFPTAIEIIAGEKKYFFTSFLSRDEAFKLINDIWLQYGNEANANMDQQESKSELNSLEHGIIETEKAKSPDHIEDEPESTERGKDVPISEDSRLLLDSENETVFTASSEVPEYLEEDSDAVLNTDLSSSGRTMAWELENLLAPKVAECYAKVAESRFPIKVEEFFNLFFSDDAVDFIESFHRKCGDKDFRCTSWQPHTEFGHARDVSFQHPIKLYLGARCGSCQEVQKFRVYRNSHLVIETSQQINDVPYGDYFRVEGLWDVQRDGDESKECCIINVYVNVAFSKKTMWKGKIVQSTVDECRDAYAIWMDIARELLKQKKIEKEEAGSPSADSIPNGQVLLERQAETAGPSERSQETSDLRKSQVLPDSGVVHKKTEDSLQETASVVAPIVSVFREYMVKFGLSSKSQSHLPLLLMITFALILLLMQLSIVVLLARPQQIQVFPQADGMGSMHTLGERSAETMAWLEKRFNHLREEMLMVETLLEKMRHEHMLLKAQLGGLENLSKQHRH